MKSTFISISFLILTITAFGQKAEPSVNQTLIQQLDSIYHDDQHYRQLSDSIGQKFGYDSKEAQNPFQRVFEKDSVNTIKVSAIIDKFGWLGPCVIGKKGNLTLFLVIQHSDLKTQEKYLPLMKEAVKKGNASGADLALLVDRVEMLNGRPQIYGSQIQMKEGKMVIYPIFDEKNVDKRRANVGLEPLEVYAKHWNIDYKFIGK